MCQEYWRLGLNDNDLRNTRPREQKMVTCRLIPYHIIMLLFVWEGKGGKQTDWVRKEKKPSCPFFFSLSISLQLQDHSLFQSTFSGSLLDHFSNGSSDDNTDDNSIESMPLMRSDYRGSGHTGNDDAVLWQRQTQVDRLKNDLACLKWALMEAISKKRCTSCLR